jgi:hypothetical protein
VAQRSALNSRSRNRRGSWHLVLAHPTTSRTILDTHQSQSISRPVQIYGRDCPLAPLKFRARWEKLFSTFKKGDIEAYVMISPKMHPPGIWLRRSIQRAQLACRSWNSCDPGMLENLARSISQAQRRHRELVHMFALLSGIRKMTL